MKDVNELAEMEEAEYHASEREARLHLHGDALSDAAFALLRVLESDGTVRSGDEEVRELRLAVSRYDSYRSER